MIEPKESKILIVEDETDIRQLIALTLTRAGYNCIQATNGLEANKILSNEVIDLVILDWMLPDTSGIEILKSIRNKNKDYPQVLMLTAKSDTRDIVEGFDSGADEYVTKPFEPSVLAARVRALFRRIPETKKHKKMIYGPIVIDLTNYMVQVNNIEINLTNSEYKILVHLVSNKGHILSREQLVAAAQGDGISVSSRTIDTHIVALRKKLGEASQYIETIRAIGYRAKKN